MSNEENIYARIITGEITEKEILDLKANGDWEAIQAVLAASDDLSLPKFDTKSNFKKLIANSSKGKETPKGKIRFLHILSIAAGISLMVGAFFMFGNTDVELAVANGKILEHTFPDRSSVILNAGSQLSYDENKWSKNRIVKLEGEAYFNVQSGNNFTVKTSKGEVLVLGTEFNVKTHDNLFKVECYSGKVRVQQGNQIVVLTKNDAVYFDEKGAKTEKAIETSRSGWLDKNSIFENENIELVLSEFARQFNVKANSNVLGLKFTGTFNYDNIEIAASQIAKPLGLKYEFSADKKSILFSK